MEQDILLASRVKRFEGAFLDGFIFILFLASLSIFLEIALKIEKRLETVILFISLIAIFSMLNCYLLVKNGQTIGKKIVGTRIVGINGLPVPFARLVLVRYFLIYCITQIPFLGNIFILADALFIFNPDRRCIHDLLAGTKVIEVQKR